MSTETSAIDLTEYVDPDQMKQDLAINPTKLSDAMQHHASLYMHYAVQAVRAKRQYERWKAAFEILEAKLDGEHRQTLKEENPKTTETQIRAAVVQDARWKACNSRMIDAQQVYRLAEIGERSFDQRKDMLLQLARDAAREADGQLRVSLNTASKDRLLEGLAAHRQAAAEKQAA